MILNPNKTRGLLDSRSRTVNFPHGDLVLSGVPICACLNYLDILGVKFDSKLTFEDHVSGIVSHVSQRFGILSLASSSWREACLCGHLCIASYTMHFFCQSLGLVLRYGGLLLNVIFSFSNGRCIRWTGFALIRLSCRCIINVMLLHRVSCTMLIRTRIIFFFSELPSASARVRYTRDIPCPCSSSIRVLSIKV